MGNGENSSNADVETLLKQRQTELPFVEFIKEHISNHAAQKETYERKLEKKKNDVCL